MSKCLIVYLSQGGSTSTIAASIAKGLRAEKHVVDLHNLKDGPPPDQQKYDVLGIGGPAYYYRPNFMVYDYVNGLPTLSGKPVFTFMVHAMYPGDAGNITRSLIQAKGAREMGYSRFFATSTFYGYIMNGYLFTPNRPTTDEIASAEAFGREISNRMAGKAFEHEAYDSRPRFMYRIERFLTQRLMIRQMFSRLFQVDRKKCNACGLCMKICPTQNIAQDSKGMPVWGRNCIACYYCEMKCTREAIASPVVWFMFKPFIIFNIRAAVSDKTISYNRVVHARGRTDVKK